MADYSLRPKAIADVDAIWDYTAETWDEEQAERYSLMLKESCARLASNPQLGRSISEWREGYRMHHVGRHMVIYCESITGIDIVRFLHQSMDYGRHL